MLNRNWRRMKNILRQLTLHYKLTTDSKLYTLNSTLYSLHLGFCPPGNGGTEGGAKTIEAGVGP